MTKKIFDRSAKTKIQLRKSICELAKQLGVTKVIFNKKGKKVRGTYSAFTNTIYLDLKQTKKEMLTTFFHELGHHKAVQQNKWKNYHWCLVPSIKLETAFKIENKIDGIGRKLWNKYVDSRQWGKYKYVYPKSQKKKLMEQIANI